MPRPGLDPAAGAALAAALSKARRPLLVVGDDCHWDPPARLREAIEKLSLPFVTARLARGVVDENHPLWIGPGYVPANQTLGRALGEADLVLLLGHHFEADLGYGQTVTEDAAVVQCVVDGATLGRNRRASLGMVAAPSAAAEVLAGLEPGSVEAAWAEGLTGAWNAERAAQAGDDPATPPVHPVAAVDAVIDALPEDTVYVTSHGNVDFWADARIKVRGHRHYLRAGQSGALGAEIPYGIGAKLAEPDRPVVVFVGDGGVGYHALELDTAARYGCPVVVVVLDDRKWSAIALPQQRDYGADYELDLPARDWPGLARALGGYGADARTLEEIGQAAKDALASGKPAIVQVPVRSVLSPYMDYVTR